MAVHNLWLKRFLLKDVASGRKDLEVRVGYEWCRKIAIGDTLIFSGQCTCTVKAIREYESFLMMGVHEDAQRIVPGWSAATLFRTLRSIYPSRKERLGVLVFELEIVPQHQKGGTACAQSYG